MTFLDVVNPTLAKCPNDSARRALIVRLLAVLGHEAVPEVWRLKWEGRVQVVYSWAGSPAGDLWLAGGRMHAGLVVAGDALSAPAAPEVPVMDMPDDIVLLERTAPKAAAALRLKLRKVVPLLLEVPEVIIPPGQRDAVLDSMRRAVAALEAA